MDSNTYDNGCPRVGWCIECERPVALRSDGVLVPHKPRKGRKKRCHSDHIPMEEYKQQEAERLAGLGREISSEGP